MISETPRQIAIGTTRLDYHQIINKVLQYLDGCIDGFPCFLCNSELDCQNEKEINTNLCIYLNANVSGMGEVDIFRFAFDKDTPVPDSNRTPDVGVMLVNKAISSKAFFHIECKRLPARDKPNWREYVVGGLGGMQRFKLGHHGGGFSHSAIIGYVQKNELNYWFSEINSWISELIESCSTDWSEGDKLIPIVNNQFNRYRSQHLRTDKTTIQLHHYWVKI